MMKQVGDLHGDLSTFEIRAANVDAVTYSGAAGSQREDGEPVLVSGDSATGLLLVEVGTNTEET